MMKLKTLALALVMAFSAARVASGQITVPNTFTTRQVISSSKMNQNFAEIDLKALNRVAPVLQATLALDANNTYDLGSSTNMFRTLYAKTSLVLGQTTANYTITWQNPASARALTIPDPGGPDTFVMASAAQGLSNKTLTAPILSGSVTGTYTLAGTPTITAPVLSGSVTGTYTLDGTPTLANATFSGTFAGSLSIADSSTGRRMISVRNIAVGTSNSAAVQVVNDIGNVALLEMFSSTFSSLGDSIADGVRLVTTGSAGLVLNTTSASALIRFDTQGAVRWGINGNGDFVFGPSTHIALSNGTPTFSSGGGNGTITGTDYGFVITTGSTTTFPIVVNYGHTYASAPVAVINCTPGGGATFPNRVSVQTTTTQVTINAVDSPLGTGTVLMVITAGS